MTSTWAAPMRRTTPAAMADENRNDEGTKTVATDGRRLAFGIVVLGLLVVVAAIGAAGDVVAETWRGTRGRWAASLDGVISDEAIIAIVDLGAADGGEGR